VYTECHPHETHFTSLFINTLPHHQKCSHDSLFNVYETRTETGLSTNEVNLKPWRHSHGAALYNRAPAVQWTTAPQCLSSANHGNPAALRLQRIYRSTALFGLTANWQ
jgi:hypothetical protein